MYLSRNDKRNINIALSAILVIAMCFCISGYTVAYISSDTDTISDSTKFYFLEKSFEYFSDFPEEEKVELDHLIKSGYAEIQDDMRHCFKDNTYIEKEIDTYNLQINCGAYYSTMKVQKKGN